MQKLDKTAIRVRKTDRILAAITRDGINFAVYLSEVINMADHKLQVPVFYQYLEKKILLKILMYRDAQKKRGLLFRGIFALLFRGF